GNESKRAIGAFHLNLRKSKLMHSIDTPACAHQNRKGEEEMKKKRLFLIGLMGSALTLSGCAGFQTSNNDDNAVNEDGKTVIDFWTFWGSEIRRPVIEQIIADFNESQDEIEVKHTYLPFGDIWTKELAAIAAGDPPDVVINDINSTALRGQENQAMNLSEFLEEDDIS